MEGADPQWDVSGLFGAGGGASALAPLCAEEDEAPRRDQEDYYLAVSAAPCAD